MPDTTKYEEKTPTKITMRTQCTEGGIEAYLYLADWERLSDAINDDRNFLPFHILDESHGSVEFYVEHINKNQILSIKEVRIRDKDDDE